MTQKVQVNERLKGYLDEGEHLLWQGAPLSGIRNVPKRAFQTLLGFGLMAWGIAILGSLVDHTLRVGLSFNSPIFLLFGIIANALGLHLSFLQWRNAARAHKNTRYALTNRCAYILVGTGFGSMESYRILPDTVTELDRHKGYSDIWFHVRYKHTSAAIETTARVGFEGILDGEKVFMLLRNIQMRTA